MYTSHLPQEVKDDRYHMQAQYCKDVLGAVRPEAAGNHQAAARILLAGAVSEDDPEQSRR